ncbi:hypothetical protein [Roseobacter sinensis]|uniref:Uncharacterized protein n=1 Tax=Roseobacter sinensis TaxID=2931391 RepID=A0ABT3BAR0_9RHOB|nr:hypothetical protein [Roseobacter sp. WL0113]MCV3270671.1 hypothetical protein [Roseobacter sp. WL0113]
MSTTIEIPPNERGVIRVFAINAPPDEIKDQLASMPKPDLARQLLNSPHLDTTSVEIFPVSDLTGMGLTAYLTEGYAVEENALATDRAKLDALAGYVLLLFSESFKGASATLSPSAELTLIGSYREYRPAAGGPTIDAESARPYSGTPQMTPNVPARGPAGSAMVVLAIIVLIGLGLWWLLT